jgi:hypothetical protein
MGTPRQTQRDEPMSETNPRAGTRLRSVACTTEVVIVRASGAAVDLRCGGAPMVGLHDATAQGPSVPADAPATLIGKRYWCESVGLELLCTKGGSGELTVGDEPMVIRSTAALPSSD